MAVGEGGGEAEGRRRRRTHRRRDQDPTPPRLDRDPCRRLAPGLAPGLARAIVAGRCDGPHSCLDRSHSIHRAV